MTTTGRSATRGISPLATGFALFASVMMIVLGVSHAAMGLVALLDDEFFVKLPNYTFKFDITGWGWLHLIGGAVIVFAGIAVLSGRLWARAVGIALAGLSAIANLAWLPYEPGWSIVLIGIDVAVIWGLAMYRPGALTSDQ